MNTFRFSQIIEEVNLNHIINNDELQTYLNKNKNNNKDMQKKLYL